MLAGEPDAMGIVGDLGGSSLELVRVDPKGPGRGETFPLGPFALMDGGFNAERIEAIADDALAQSRVLPARGETFLRGRRRVARVGTDRHRVARSSNPRTAPSRDEPGQCPACGRFHSQAKQAFAGAAGRRSGQARRCAALCRRYSGARVENAAGLRG
ncbi:MAG: hypothetical protein WDN76_12830 [Alphaproteobacteria bacterium]